ncbi:MAG: ribose-phosphate pyrophosphokinase [Caulobacteraceae bacterium]
MKPLFLPMPGNDVRAAALALLCGGEVGDMNLRRFPDAETYFRIAQDVADRQVVLVCTLSDPDPKTLPLLFAAATVRELGAKSVGLVAPYLPYMRQDRRFQPGEPISARLYANLLSQHFSWLVTVDPHLHRIHDLSQLYSLPVGLVAAAPVVAEWIRRTVPDPLIVGPDAESAQWVAQVAGVLQAPFVVMDKTRRGDRSVEITAPDLSAHHGRTPVFVDDIVSSGGTILAVVRELRRQGFLEPVCVVIHALFSTETGAELTSLGARLISVDTAPHPTNGISVDAVLASETRRRLGL